ncbi:hypothetical protein [Streptomyces sp. NPDC048639]|uniref:hypothetical protein n=1 Tax=Streptomyces sp. NPDC048639 TaxID=3365581 RepID=UPI003718F2A7
MAETEAARLKERIYSTITMLAVVVALADTESASRWDAAAVVIATAAGLWLATLVADDQAHRAVHGRGADRRERLRMLYVSSPLMLSAVGPLVMTALSALGALSLDSALLISAGAGVVSLFGWGYAGGRRMGAHPATAVVGGVLDTVIGVAVVAIKLVAQH